MDCLAPRGQHVDRVVYDNEHVRLVDCLERDGLTIPRPFSGAGDGLYEGASGGEEVAEVRCRLAHCAASLRPFEAFGRRLLAVSGPISLEGSPCSPASFRLTGCF